MVSFNWTCTRHLNVTPVCTPTETTTYTVTITTSDNCVVEEEVTVTVFLKLPVVQTYDPSADVRRLFSAT